MSALSLRRALRRALAVAALALAGCGAIQGVKSRLPPREPQPGPDAGEWGEARDGASRRATLYDGFVHRADASATWLALPVREAATRRLAAWQAWGEADVEAALATDRAEAAAGEEFLVALYAAEPKDNDLDAKPSMWRVELDDGATRAVAASATAVPADSTLKTLFPYVGPFDHVYRVKFAWKGTPLAGRAFVLRLASARGKLELDFGPRGQPPDRPRVAP